MTSEFSARHRVMADVSTTGWKDLSPGISGACRMLERHGLARDPWFFGDPPGEQITLTQDSVTACLEHVAEARAQGIATPCVLVSGPLVVVVEVAHTVRTPIATLWFMLPTPPPLLDPLMSLVRDVAEALGAHHAHVEEEQLLLLYQSRRATERALAAVPPEYRQYVPDPPEAHAAGPVPDLLVPQEYDTRKVPAGVWWVNYWGRVQVRTLSEHRVREAPWARFEETADGAFVLAATEDPLDPSRSDHVTRLSELLDYFNLREVQERYRDSVI